MTQLLQRRGLFTHRGFSLVELLITFSIIGIITALLIPNIIQARQESIRQGARQQTKTLETALANWFTAQSSVASASLLWNQFAGGDGYINNTATVGGLDFLSSSSGLAPYLPDNSVTFSFDVNTTNPTAPNDHRVIVTTQMLQIPLSNGNFIGGAPPSGSTISSACVYLYWDPTRRATTSPKVLFFLPDM